MENTGEFKLVIGNASATHGRLTLYVANTNMAQPIEFEVHKLETDGKLQEKLKVVFANILETGLPVEYGEGVLDLLKRIINFKPTRGHKKCNSCGRFYFEAPALSRKDNKTEICSDCGLLEAMDDFIGK